MVWDGHQVVMVARQSRLVAGKAEVVAGDRWLPLPKPPSRAGPPLSSAGPERALVRLDSPTSAGATQLYVLEPAQPEP